MISQPEYDCPAQQEHDPMLDVLLWVAIGALACAVVLLGALIWVVIA